MSVICLWVGQAAPIENIAKACFRWTPKIAINDDSVFLDIKKCQFLYSTPTLIRKLKELLKQHGLRERIAIASTIQTSLALARFGCKHKNQLSIDALIDFGCPFDKTLSGNIHSLIHILQSLGIKTIYQFSKLTLSSLSSRFGSLGNLLYQRVHDEPIPWPRFFPSDCITESEDFSYSIQSLDRLLFTLKRLVDQAKSRIKTDRIAVSKLTLRLDTITPPSSENERSWIIEFSVPQRSSLSIVSIFKERLNKDLLQNPLMAPVTSMVFKVLVSVPESNAQATFCKQEDYNISWNTLIGRLCDRIGKNHVFWASPKACYLPEQGWEKTLQPHSPTDIQLPFPKRPLRLLTPPIPLVKKEGMWINGHQKHCFVEHQGPERVSGHWWLNPFNRDYYCVVTNQSERFWIYRLVNSNLFFLHGVFD